MYCSGYTSSVSFLIYDIVLSPFGVGQWMPTKWLCHFFWVLTFSHSLITQRKAQKSEGKKRHTEGVFSLEIDVPLFFLLPAPLFFLTLSLNCRCQIISQQTLHSPRGCYQNLFLLVPTFLPLPFFPLYLGHNL